MRLPIPLFVAVMACVGFFTMGCAGSNEPAETVAPVAARFTVAQVSTISRAAGAACLNWVYTNNGLWTCGKYVFDETSAKVLGVPPTRVREAPTSTAARDLCVSLGGTWNPDVINRPCYYPPR